MKSLPFAILSLALIPAFSSARSQDAPKPVISVPPPPAPALPPASTAGQVAAPASASPVNATDPSTYIIGPQDSLSILVWKEPSFSGPAGVRSDGMITLPLLGDLKASGFTPTQLAEDLTTRLKKYVNDPLVTVTVLAVNSKHIYLAGEIGHVGEMAYTPDMTPLQAILAGGGPSPYAKKKNIYILRGEKGKQVKFPFNYNKAIKTGDQQGVTLLPGDTIVVP